MTILAWDVETTGIPDFKARSDDPKQPHIVQLGLVDYDDAGKEVMARQFIIRPNGWVIPAEMTEIHGISHERALDEGIPEDTAITCWLVAQGKAKLRVAHNISFDTRMARIALVRAGYEREFIEQVEARPSFCTCTGTASIVDLPPTPKMVQAGLNKPKLPSLAEAMKYFFDEEIVGAHDALVDARCAGRIYWRLRATGEAPT